MAERPGGDVLLRLIDGLGEVLTSATELSELMQPVLELIVEDLRYHFVAYGAVQDDRSVLYEFWVGAVPREVEDQDRHLVRDRGITGRTVRSGETQVISDTSADPDFVEFVINTKSEMCIPVKIEDRVVGVLNVQADYLDAFSDEDQRILNTFANLLGTALYTRDVQLKEERKSRWLGVLNRAQRVMSASLELDTLFVQIVELLCDIMKFGAVSVGVLDYDQNRVYSKIRATPEGLFPVFYEQPMHVGIVGRAVNSGQIQVVQDVSADPDYIEVLEGMRSEMVIPLAIDDRVQYVLNIESPEAARFDRDEAHHLHTLGMIMSQGLGNARSFRRERNRAEELEVLHQLAKVSVSTLDAGEVARRCAETLVKLGTVEDAEILFVDESGENMEMIARAGIFGEGQEGYVQPLGQGVVGWVVRNNKSRIVYNTEQDALFTPVPWIESGSELAVPLNSRTGTVGAMNFEHRKKYAFEPRDIPMFEAMADIVANAIENARLYSRQREMTEQLDVLFELARVSVSSLDTQKIAQRSVDVLLQLGRVDDAGVLLLDPDGETLRLVGKSGVFDDGPENYTQSAHVGILGWVVQHGRPRIVNDPAVEEDFLDVDWIEAGSEVAIPLRSRRGIVGVLDFEHRKKNAFSESQLPMFEAAAGLVANAIENAHLFSRERDLGREIVQLQEQREMWYKSISHELRTPLNAILAFSEMMKTDELDQEEQLSMADRIHIAGAQLLSLVNHQLDLSRLTSGVVEMEKKDFDWDQLQQELESTITPLALAAGIDFEMEWTGKVHGDPFWLRQVAVNLLANGVKYSKAGQTIRIIAADNVMKVIDTGSGIEEEKLEFLFEPFYQTHAEHAALGTGLGLAVCRAVVDLHGGTIRAESEVGEGTTFTIELPLASLAG